jgi:hypothetical protein
MGALVRMGNNDEENKYSFFHFFVHFFVRAFVRSLVRSFVRSILRITNTPSSHRLPIKTIPRPRVPPESHNKPWCLVSSTYLEQRTMIRTTTLALW